MISVETALTRSARLWGDIGRRCAESLLEITDEETPASDAKRREQLLDVVRVATDIEKYLFDLSLEQHC